MPEEDQVSRARRLWKWFDRRTGLDQLLHKSLDEPIPGGARFAYIFGSGLLFIFLSQIITGICLTLYYVPSAETAHVSVAYMVKEVTAGSFLRSLHSYGSSAMIVVLLLHFLQTFLYGSYKGKRELLWISGGVLSLLILGMAFTGYLLPWDQKAYFATSVGTNIAGQVPFIGEWIRRLLRGGAAMGTLTISRFYVLHVFVIPAAILLFVAVHIFMFRKAGAAGPIGEDPVQPRMKPEMFYPKQVLMDMGFALILIAVLGILAHFHPVELGPVANPNDSQYLPRPEWYYLPMFQWLKYWEGPRTVIGIIIIPAILLVLFFLLPFLDRGPERRPWRRPIPLGAVMIVLLGAIWLGVISHIRDYRDPSVSTQLAKQDKEESDFSKAPFEPYLASSHSATPSPAALSGLDAQGKAIFDAHGCSGCHGEGGIGGPVGPPLIHIGDKFQETALVNVLRTPTPKMLAGHMAPVDLSLTDMTALTSYLRDLGSAGSPAAVVATMPQQSVAPLVGSTPTPLSSPPAAAPATPAAAATSAAGNTNPSAGREIFQARACFACHGEGGVGTTRAPALTGIGAKRSSAEIAGLLRNPNSRMRAGGMSPLTASADDLNSLVGYLRNLKAPGTRRPSGANIPEKVAGVGAESAPPVSRSSSPSDSATSPETTSKLTNPPSVVDSHIAQQPGRAIFESHGCAACHGVGGIGTRAAPALASIGKRLQPSQLANLLLNPTEKMRSGGMPPVILNGEEMKALTGYIQYLGKQTATASATPSAPSPVRGGISLPPVMSVALPPMNEKELAGKAVFESRRCGSCHGAEGREGTAAAPPLAGAGGNLPPEVLAQMLRHPTDRMRQGGMPAISASDTELDALIAYVRRVSASMGNH